MVPRHKQDENEDKKIRILIVDDHPVVRQGLCALVHHERDMMICGEAEDARQALLAVAELKPDVVLVDISLKNSNGIDLTRNLKAAYPQLAIIVLSVHDEAVYAERALVAGARAYLMKDAASEHIIKAIHTVLAGEIYVSSAISKKFLHTIAQDKTGTAKTPVDTLSDRELEIFRMIGQGYKASQIAECLFLSTKTVETYRSRIKLKLHLPDAAELLRYSIKWAKGQGEA